MSSVIIYRHNQLKTLSLMLDPFIDKRTFANVGMNFTEHFNYTGQIITLDILNNINIRVTVIMIHRIIDTCQLLHELIP